MEEYTFGPYLTSQLAVCHAVTGDDAFKEEFFRRLKRCGEENDAVIEALFQYNKDVYANNQNHELGSEEFVRKSYFDRKHRVSDRPLEELVEEDLLTPSEVIKLFDEAEWVFQNLSRENCPKDVWEEIYRTTRFYPKNQGAKLLVACREKLLCMGLCQLAIQNLIANDKLILNIYHWYCKFEHPYAPPRAEVPGKKKGFLAKFFDLIG